MLAASAVASAKPPAPAEYVGECPARERTVCVLAAFLHGKGADKNAPPLNRECALAIIRRELARVGANIAETDVLLRSIPRFLDGFDPKYRIGVIYLEEPDRGLWPRSVEVPCELPDPSEYKGLAQLARYLSSRAGLDPAVEHLGVFYDPEAPTFEEAVDLLRAQVRDFVACLRLAGVR